MDGFVLPTLAQAVPPYDPLSLRQRLVEPVDKDLSFRRRRKLQKFYDNQNEHIESLLKPLESHVLDAEEEERKTTDKVRDNSRLREEPLDSKLSSLIWGPQIKWVIYLNIGVTFILAGVQLYAAISSLSLALFATAADVVFDPVRRASKPKMNCVKGKNIP
jgi:hypothetical protein